MVARFNLNVDQSIQMDGTMKVVWYPSREGEWVRYTDYADRIEELKEKLHQRGQVIAAHISIDDLQTSWDRIIVAEYIREQKP